MQNLLIRLREVDYADLPILKICFIVGLFIFALLLQRVVYAIASQQLNRLADQVGEELDEYLLNILRPSINLLVYLGCIWLIPLILVRDLNRNTYDTLISLLGILTIFAVVFILYRMSAVIGYFVTNFILKILGRISQDKQALSSHDLLKILKPSVRLLTFLLGLWSLQLFVGSYLNNQLNEAFHDVLGLLSVVIITSVVYRSSSLLGEIAANILLAATEDLGLSDLLRPFLPKLFQAIAIMVLVIKGAAIFFGDATGALVGLLGGAGITLGLLFKDLIYDWFCTVIIYTDKLYREGDWIVIDGLNDMVQVVFIGFRSTSLLSLTCASIQKIPNSKMISGILQNWSQNAGEEEIWGIPITLKIDCISAAQSAQICEGLRDIHNSLDGVKEEVLIRFKGIEGNARVFEFRLFTEFKSFFRIEREAHLAILAMLEAANIKTLNVELKTEPDSYYELLRPTNN